MARIIGKWVGRLANCAQPWVKNALIRLFCMRYTVDKQELQRRSVDEYRSFNDFFTRELRPDARPVADGDGVVVAPCDGTLSVMDNPDRKLLIQVKGNKYSIADLLGGSADAQPYESGTHFCIYLAPHNYHRVHMPLGGRLQRCDYIPGAFFPVNTIATRMVPRLFCRNERLLCYFDCGGYSMVVIFVAAFLVGGICTIWQEDSCNAEGTRIINAHCEKAPKRYTLKQGAELGRFQFGSTVVVLISKPMRTIMHDVPASCQMGQGLARLDI